MRRPRRAAIRWVCAALSAALLAPLVTAQTTTSAARVLVMPFEPARVQPRSYWLREGSAVILTDGLLAIGLPAMRRDERQQAFDLLGVPSASALSYASVVRVGQTLGASEVVVGEFDLVKNELTVRARSILLDTGSMGAEVVERGPVEDLFAVYDRVAMRLVPGATGQGATLAASHPPILAFEQFIKGLLVDATESKLGFLEEAIRLDPSFERARAATWSVHHATGDHEAALEAVEQIPEGHPLGRQARFLASVSLTHLERYAEAHEVLTQLNAEAPDATLLNNLGVVQLRRTDGIEGGRAVSYFAAAAALDGWIPSSTSDTPTGSTAMRMRPSSGCGKRCAGIRRTRRRTSCSGPPCPASGATPNRRGSVSWQDGCRLASTRSRHPPARSPTFPRDSSAFGWTSGCRPRCASRT